jgi:hypothetical protein
MRVVPQGASDVLDVPGVMPTDAWVRAELHVIAETSGGDGAVYLYIDGDLADSNESVDWNGSPAPWNGMEWYAHINDISTNSVYRVGHFYISGKN